MLGRKGQLEGSVAGGMAGLYEEVLTEKGQVQNPSFLDYGFSQLPSKSGHPTSIEVETNDPEGPFGAKESGEGTPASPAPAIVNALYDAIGVRV